MEDYMVVLKDGVDIDAMQQTLIALGVEVLGTIKPAGIVLIGAEDIESVKVLEGVRSVVMEQDLIDGALNA